MTAVEQNECWWDENVKPIERIGRLHINRILRTVKYNGQPVKLRPKEFLCLSYLMHHKNRIIPRVELILASGGSLKHFDDVIDVNVCGIRKAFRAVQADCTYIKTVEKKRGYAFSSSKVMELQPS
jgi:DNA-binding response OmpR family regulator